VTNEICPNIVTHDLARAVDPESSCGQRSRKVERAEAARAVKKSMGLATCVIVDTHNLAGSVDAARLGQLGAREVKGAEGAVVEEPVQGFRRISKR
jgi:hypothetical protein